MSGPLKMNTNCWWCSIEPKCDTTNSARLSGKGRRPCRGCRTKV
ncbi:hypothetical protein DO73_4187 [Burkholderia pseudomallei]|nr:hypothetical protein DO73_4187 [Burkholderia pseudomallei]